MTNPAIETRELQKIYRAVWSKPAVALRDVSLRVDRGTIFGLIGQNGAGKTSLVKILLGLSKLTSGSASLLGASPGNPIARRRVGYLPEQMRIPEYFKAEDFLRYMGRLNRVDSATLSRRIPELLERVGLAGIRKPVQAYSKGMQQRLGLAQALVIGTQPGMPAAVAVPVVLESELRATGQLWLLLVIFAAVPLLTATLEKGWLELTFSKATSRWRILVGRFLGGVTMYGIAFLLATFPVAARLWWVTGIATWQVAVALLIQSFSFAALLSVAALAALPQKGVSLPIFAAVGLWLLSGPLAARQTIYYRLFTSHLSHEMLDWAYRILPKSSELESVSVSLIQSGRLELWWWPFWSTGLFTLAILGLSLWLLERKSF